MSIGAGQTYKVNGTQISSADLSNDANITNYWANWDLCNTASIMAIGILTDDTKKAAWL